MPEEVLLPEENEKGPGLKKRSKFGRIVRRTLFGLFLLFGLPILVIQFPPVQTWLVHKVSAALSGKLETTVAVRSVSIRFFNKVVLNGVYIEDLNRDTMIYMENIVAKVNKLPLFGNPLVVGSLELSDGLFNLRTDSIGANIAGVLAKLASTEPKDTTSKPSTFILEANSLKLNNCSFSMILLDAPTLEEKPYGIIFQNARLDSVYLSADRIALRKDSIFFRLQSLALHERSGFRLRHLSVDTGYVCFGKDVYLKKMELRDDYSEVHLNHFRMQYNGGLEFKDFVNKVNMEADIANSQLSFATIGFFAPTLRHIPIKATARGFLSGTVSNIKGTDLHITALDGTVLDGRFSIQGLPNIESAIIFANLTQLSSTRKDAVRLLEGVTSNNLAKLNTTLSGVNRLNFSGTFTGLVNDFVANGKLVSDVGSLNMDILFTTEEGMSTILKGRLVAKQLEVGQLLQSELFGAASFNLMLDGKFSPNNRNDIFSEGSISTMLLNGYEYQDISLSGRLVNTEFNGSVKISDPNVDFDFLGKVNLRGTLEDPTPLFDFVADVRHVDLVKLNFNKRDSVSIFSGKINANFKGNNILNYVGELSLVDAHYKDVYGTINLGNISLYSTNSDNKNILSLKSNFIDVQYIGKYELIGLVNDVEKLVYSYFPALNPIKAMEQTISQSSTDSYELHVKTKRSGEVARILHPGLFIAENSQLDVSLNTQSQIKINLSSSKIQLNENKLSDLIIVGDNTPEVLRMDLSSGNAELAGVSLMDFKVKNTVQNNLLNTKVSFSDTAKRQSKADMTFHTQFIRPTPTDSLKLKINMDSTSSLMFHGREWNFSPFYVEIDSSRIFIQDFDFYREGQHLRSYGVISHQPNDTLKVSLENYNLTGLSSLTQRRGYEIGGSLSGDIEMTGVYDKLHLNLNLMIDNMLVNKDTLGNIIIASAWDREQERLEIISRIYNQQGIITSINGFFVPETRKIQLDAQISKLKLLHLNPLLEGILSEIDGVADGWLSCRGTAQAPLLTGKLNVRKMAMKVDYLQTKYIVDASVDIDSSSFTIQNGQITDPSGHSGALKVEVKHDNFANITFDAFASLRNMLCLNTKEKDNPMFYGTAYATGGIGINGTPQEFNFDIVAQAEKNSILYIPLAYTSEAKDLAFLRFKVKDTLAIDQPIALTPPPKAKITLRLNLSVTPESEIQILIDEKLGDIIRARGQGNLKIDIDPSINLFNIVGDYRIEKGDYNFTVPNFSIISRKFNIDKGSQISFNGDIVNAELNVKASYKERVSLSVFASNNDLSSRRYPVICEIFITGKMMTPNLRFNIEFLDLDPEKKARIQSSINTEEKMTRQFLALLVAKTFIPDQDFVEQSDIGSTALFGNATELISRQLGSIVSMFNLPIPLDVSVDYTADSKSRGPEYDFDFSTQLFDRVLINGSASNSSRADRNFAGDFEAEVLLTKDGRFRSKVFTKAHDYFFGDLESNRQGVGISYQGEFEKVRDLFLGSKKKKEAKKKREEENKKKKEEENKKRREEEDKKAKQSEPIIDVRQEEEGGESIDDISVPDL